MCVRAALLLALVACGPAKDPSTDTGVTITPGGDLDTGVDTDTDTGADTDSETGGTETGGTETGETDTVDTATGDTGEDTSSSTTPPLSSRCVVAADTTGACTHGVYADDWTGDARYTWEVTDGYNHSTLSVTEGGVTSEITRIVTTSSWHMVGGLTVMPDGDLILGGMSLPYVTLTVGTESVYLGADYVRFVMRLSPEGELRWVDTFVGVTAESIVVAARSDDTALVSGFVYQDTSFGAIDLTTTYFYDMAFVAAVDGDGTWLWASSAPVPSTGTTRVYFDDMQLNADEEAEVDVRYQSSTDVSEGSFTCAARAICAATATVNADGEWTSVTAR